MPVRSSLLLVGYVGGLLLGGFLGTGCTPDSSGSSAPPDTTTVSTTAAASSSAEPPTEPTAPIDSSDDRTVAERLADASVTARVRQSLVRTRSLRPFDFALTAVQGHLTLRGDVETREQYRRAERVASNVEGVTDVTNQVTVQGKPLSESGDPTGATYHTVRQGETLSEIARVHDVSVQQLRALNDLSGTLQSGQQIRVR